MVLSGVKEIHRSERGGKKSTSIVLYKVRRGSEHCGRYT